MPTGPHPPRTQGLAETTVRKADLPTPTVIIAGAPLIVSRAADRLLLRSDASMPVCNGSSANSTRFTFLWEQVTDAAALPASFPAPSALPVAIAVASQRTLTLPPASLRAGETYAFAVTVTALDGTGAAVGSARAFVAVSAAFSPLRVGIVGGDRTISRDPGQRLNLTLDGSLSGDPDNATGPLVYNWQCQRKNTTDNTVADCFGAPLPNTSAVLTVFAPTLGSTSLDIGPYVFTLQVPRLRAAAAGL